MRPNRPIFLNTKVWDEVREGRTPIGAIVLALDLVMYFAFAGGDGFQAFAWEPESLRTRLLEKGVKSAEEYTPALFDTARRFFFDLPDGRVVPSAEYFILNDPDEERQDA